MSNVAKEIQTEQPKEEQPINVCKIFIGSLSFKTTKLSLTKAFENINIQLKSAKVVRNGIGRSMGYGFIELSESDAEVVIEKLHHTELDGRTINVERATSTRATKPRRPKPRRNTANRSDKARNTNIQPVEKTKPTPKESQPPKESKVPREPKIPREPKEPREPRAPKEPREPREPKIPREPREPKVPREPREPKVPREPREPKVPREPKIQREPRESKFQKESQSSNETPPNTARGTKRKANREPKPKPAERELSDTKLYVANIPFSLKDESLAKIFSDYGCIEAKVIVNRKSNRSRGYGFVDFENNEQQQNALKEKNKTTVESEGNPGRVITVRVAYKEQEIQQADIKNDSPEEVTPGEN